MFTCDKCGECCKNIGSSEFLKEFDRGDGVCKYLDLETNLCKIYDNRPEICKVDRMYEKYFQNFYTKEKFYDLNYKACDTLKKLNKE